MKYSNLRFKKMKLKAREVLFTILLIVSASLSLLISIKLISLESTVTILFFNLFFIPLIFQLRSATIKKEVVLIIGNLIGVTCNVIFFNLCNIEQPYYGVIEIFYVLFYPFLNLLWIIPFWSFSLSFLTEARTP